MEAIFKELFFAIVGLSFLILAGYKILEKKDILEYFFLIIIFYLVSILAFTYYVTSEKIIEYRSFNNLDEGQIVKITINGQILPKEMMLELFRVLKEDEVAWINHADVLRQDTIAVYTKLPRDYRFAIEITSNEGVLIERIDRKGKAYVANRNNKLKDYIRSFPAK